MPEGCLSLLGGRWVHAQTPAWAWDGVDDGGTLTLWVTHQPAPDAGFSPRRFRRDAGTEDAGTDDAGVDAGEAGDAVGAARVELTRTAEGFAGATIATLRHPTGRACEARFPTRVVSCDGGLTLETTTSLALGDACQPPALPGEVTVEQHHLIRPDAG